MDTPGLYDSSPPPAEEDDFSVQRRLAVIEDARDRLNLPSEDRYRKVLEVMQRLQRKEDRLNGSAGGAKS